MKPIDICLGNFRKCCCCSLAAGAIVWTVLFVLAAIINPLLENSVLNIIASVVIAVQAILLIWALIKQNWLPLLIACGCSLTDLVLSLINLFAFKIPAHISKDEVDKGTQIVSSIITTAFNILGVIWFISIILSLANVYMMSGTGWECKTWKELREEKENVKTDNEETKDDAPKDIEISH